MCNTIQDEKDRIYGKCLRIADDIGGHDELGVTMDKLSILVGIEEYRKAEGDYDEFWEEHLREQRPGRVFEAKLRKESQMMGAITMKEGRR